MATFQLANQCSGKKRERKHCINTLGKQGTSVPCQSLHLNLIPKNTTLLLQSHTQPRPHLLHTDWVNIRCWLFALSEILLYGVSTLCDTLVLRQVYLSLIVLCRHVQTHSQMTHTQLWINVQQEENHKDTMHMCCKCMWELICNEAHFEAVFTHCFFPLIMTW